MADGHLNYCKSCVKERGRKYRRSHREQCAQYEKTRADLPHRVEARRRYLEAHKEQIAEYKKAWTKANDARIAAFKREYYERNREEVIARSTGWAENNLEKVRQFKANNRRKRRAAKNAGRGSFTAKEKNSARDMATNA